jgi:hypothetical protein
VSKKRGPKPNLSGVLRSQAANPGWRGESQSSEAQKVAV